MLELEQLTVELPETHSPEDQYQAEQLQQIYLDSMDRLSPQRRRVFQVSPCAVRASCKDAYRAFLVRGLTKRMTDLKFKHLKQ